MATTGSFAEQERLLAPGGAPGKSGAAAHAAPHADAKGLRSDRPTLPHAAAAKRLAPSAPRATPAPASDARVKSPERVLPVSNPGDAMEQEAHRVADAVTQADTCADCGGAMKPKPDGASECATCGAAGAKKAARGGRAGGSRLAPVGAGEPLGESLRR